MNLCLDIDMQVLFFLFQLLVLFVMSVYLTRFLSRILSVIFKSHTLTIHILSFVFLPGVIVHELSHLLLANILLVPTGEIEFMPEVRGGSVKMGSVAIAKTDPLRRFLIGVAPILGGLFILFIAFWYLGSLIFPWAKILLLYIVFEVSNTMFSSRKDMEGAIGLAIVAVLGVGALQILGLPILQFLTNFFLQKNINSLFTLLNIFLGISIALDIFIVGISFFILKLLRKHY